MMTAGFFQFVSSICAVIACACAMFVAWRANQWRNSDEVRDGFKSAAARTASLEGRVAVVETRLEHMPTAEQVNGIKSALSRLEGEMDGVQATMTKVEMSVNRIESWLIEGRGK